MSRAGLPLWQARASAICLLGILRAFIVGIVVCVQVRRAHEPSMDTDFHQRAVPLCHLVLLHLVSSNVVLDVLHVCVDGWLLCLIHCCSGSAVHAKPHSTEANENENTNNLT